MPRVRPWGLPRGIFRLSLGIIYVFKGRMVIHDIKYLASLLPKLVSDPAYRAFSYNPRHAALPRRAQPIGPLSQLGHL